MGERGGLMGEGGLSRTLKLDPDRLTTEEEVEGAVHASQMAMSSGFEASLETEETAMFCTHCCRIASCAASTCESGHAVVDRRA